MSKDFMYGLDVSHWQGEIIWYEVFHENPINIEFVYIKASEAGHFTDQNFTVNYLNARSYIRKVGAYHFFRANVDPRKQVSQFLKVLGTTPYIDLYDEEEDLPPALDLESYDGMTSKEVAENAVKFLEEFKQWTGITPIVYTFPDFGQRVGGYSSISAYDLWIASYRNDLHELPKLPSHWKGWKYWQYTDKGRLNGIKGSVDLNRTNPLD